MAPDEMDQDRHQKRRPEELEDALPDQIRAKEQEIRELRGEIREKEEDMTRVENEIAIASATEVRKSLEAKLQFRRQLIFNLGQQIYDLGQQIINLGQQITSLQQELSNLRHVQEAPASAVNAAEPSELARAFTQFSLQLQHVQNQVGDVKIQLQKQNEDVGNIKEQMAVVLAQVDSNSSSLPSVTAADKGLQVMHNNVTPVVPKPLSTEEAEALWPTVCWEKPEKLSLENYFQELLRGLIDDDSLCWKLKLIGSRKSVSGRDIHPDAVMYKRPPSENIDPVPLTTGAILEIQSGSGFYNSSARIGKAASYGEKMLENLMGFRHSVLVGVTNLEKVLWFKVTRVKERFRSERHRELNDVRGSLCALLKSSLSNLGVELPVLAVSGVEYEPICFLGSGATSNVLCVKGKDAGEYAAKVPFRGRELWNDHEMLARLNDAKGVPKTLGWFDDGASLRMHRVGERISHKSISSCWSLVPGLVDVLERAHACGLINRDVRPDNIMIAKGESEESEMLYILDWGFAVTKGVSYPFSGGVMYASERILEQLASGNRHVVVDEWDDTEALVYTIFALRYKVKNKELRRIKREDYDGIGKFWSECCEEYPGWQSAWAAARSGDYVKLKFELGKMIP